ncbi:MAG: hypothetical protein KIT31_26325 [Deltaproteobacteria bacterium]|nr:hypothetical protein [Deltaproteobacteria bacterium]
MTYFLEPTVAEVRAALLSLWGRKPDVFVLWNSGHGSPRGPVFANGVMRFEELGWLVAGIGARHSLLGLDICHAGGYLVKKGALGETIVGGLGPEYLAALAAATPSARVLCSVGHDQLAHEGIGVNNGHMTAAFLEAVSVGRGDRSGLLSDATIVAGVRRISRQRWKQDPELEGITADFPVIYDQRELAGDAAIIGTDTLGATYRVSAYVTGRRGVPTRFGATLVNRQGGVLTRFERRFVPHEDEELVSAEFNVPLHAIERDTTSLAYHFSAGIVPVTWHVAVEDFRGRQLDACHANVALRSAA